jgi:hypothetical protein
MEENKRLHPVGEEVFNRKLLPVIEKSYIREGHPPRHRVMKKLTAASRRHLSLAAYTAAVLP